VSETSVIVWALQQIWEKNERTARH